MSTQNQTNTSTEELRTVKDIIHAIEAKSAGGGYIYRGERKCYPNVSSSLYREFKIEGEFSDIEVVQKEMLDAAKKHIGPLPQNSHSDFEILTELQHYGGNTNLIDFTTDYRIALFFACDGTLDKDGRIIILQKIEAIQDWIRNPQSPHHRVIAQKSVFISPPKGFIERHECDIVTVPADLKQPILVYLRNYHGISTETIYNDLHGFIRNQAIHGGAYTAFYKGFGCQAREDYEKAIEHYTKAIELRPDFPEAYNNRGIAYCATDDYERAIADYTQAIQIKPDYASAYHNRGITYAKKGDYELAIEDYNKAIQLKPELTEAYSNRGKAWLHLQAWDKARTDLTIARDKGVDIIAAFHNNYEGVADFEQRTGFQLPKDIVALLTPPQA